MLPLVLNVRKVARRDKHFVAHFLAALLAPCPRRLYRCPKSLEVVFWYWSFCHNYSPYYILLFTFLLGYVYTVLLVSQNNSYVYVDNYPLFLYSIIKRGKCFCPKCKLTHIVDVEKLEIIIKNSEKQTSPMRAAGAWLSTGSLRVLPRRAPGRFQL